MVAIEDGHGARRVCDNWACNSSPKYEDAVQVIKRGPNQSLEEPLPDSNSIFWVQSSRIADQLLHAWMNLDFIRIKANAIGYIRCLANLFTLASLKFFHLSPAQSIQILLGLNTTSGVNRIKIWSGRLCKWNAGPISVRTGCYTYHEFITITICKQQWPRHGCFPSQTNLEVGVSGEWTF